MKNKEQKTKKTKKKMKRWVKILIIILGIILITAACGWYLISNFTDKGKGKSTVKVIDQIEEYGYTLNENETRLYKDLFKQLTKTLNKKEIDNKEYAELVVKLFVADFYNLDNKITKNDIGGTQFIHSEALDNFILKSKDTFYKGIKSNVYEDRKQELPIVSEVDLENVESTTFKKGDEELEAYKVDLSWDYEEDLGYEDEKEFILIFEDKKLSIVEMNDIVETDSED